MSRSQPKLLPPPIQPEVSTPEPARPDGEQPETSGGNLLDGLKSIFAGKSHESESSQNPTLPNPPVGAGTKTSSSGEAALSPEAEAQLSAVPDHIGEGGADVAGSPVDVQQGEEGELGSLLDGVTFEEQDVKDVLALMFDWLADRFNSDHWKLNDIQQRMLGRPGTQLANALFAKLKDRLPESLANWCDSTPGATMFFLAATVIVVPKITKQFQLSRTGKKRVIDQPAPEQRRAVPVPATTQTHGVPAMAGKAGE